MERRSLDGFGEHGEKVRSGGRKAGDEDGKEDSLMRQTHGRSVFRMDLQTDHDTCWRGQSDATPFRVAVLVNDNPG